MAKIVSKDEAREVLIGAKRMLNAGTLKFDAYVAIKKKCKVVLLAK